MPTLENNIKDLSADDKYEFLCRTEELLRLDHNKKGADYRAEKITQAEWRDFLKNDFEPKSRKVGHLRAVEQEKKAVVLFGKAGNLSDEQQKELGELKTQKKLSARFDSQINLSTI